MPELDAEHRDQIAAAVGAHRVNYHHRNVGPEPVTAENLRYTSCDGCEWLGGHRDEAGWEAHLADALAPLVAGWLADARADALREAADELNTTDHSTETALSGVDHAIDWLRDRAHSYRCGDGWNPTPPEGGYTAEDF